jgi:hypothetical protein
MGLEMDGAMQHAPQPSRHAWGEETIDMTVGNSGNKATFSHASPLRFVNSLLSGCDLITQGRRSPADYTGMIPRDPP